MKITLGIEELDGIWIMEISLPIRGLADAFLGSQGKRRAFPTKDMFIHALPEMLEQAIKEERAKAAGPGVR